MASSADRRTDEEETESSSHPPSHPPSPSSSPSPAPASAPSIAPSPASASASASASSPAPPSASIPGPETTPQPQPPPIPTPPPLDHQRHVRYFSRCLRRLPGAYSALDTNRLTLAHFAIQSLDLLGALDDNHTNGDDDDGSIDRTSAVVDRRAVTNWIYSLQCAPPSGGFKGGTFLGAHHLGAADRCGECSSPPSETVPASDASSGNEYDVPHVAMTYTALCALAASGDDLKRFDRDGAVRSLRELQGGDGSFQSTKSGSERDIRFLYCACAISRMLNDWSGVDVDKAASYVARCRSYDGGVGLMPGQEGHGGSTFCGIASLYLMGRLHSAFESDPSWRPDLVRWCVSRQVSRQDYDGGTGGMQGRPNKAEDTCYSYWVGGTLRLLGEAEAEGLGGAKVCDDRLLNRDMLTSYVLRNQTPMGGFSKVMGANPDVMHSFYSVAWLSLASDDYGIGGAGSGGDEDAGEEDGENPGSGLRRLRRMDCALGMRADRTEAFRRLFGSSSSP